MVKDWVDGDRMSSIEYTGKHGLQCPFCRSLTVEHAEKPHFDEVKPTLSIKALCTNCGKWWWETYRLTGYSK